MARLVINLAHRHTHQAVPQMQLGLMRVQHWRARPCPRPPAGRATGKARTGDDSMVGGMCAALAG